MMASAARRGSRESGVAQRRAWAADGATQQSSGVQQGIGRAVSVLEAIAFGDDEHPRASDIARAVGLGASTIARLLGTLEELGLVTKDARTGTYAIGPHVSRLATAGLNRDRVHHEARMPAQELAHRTGLAVQVGEREGASLRFLCHFEGALAPKSQTMIGMRQPLHATSLGKWLLTRMAPEERRELIGPDPLPRYTTHTLTTHAALDADLEHTLEAGIARCDQELALGRMDVGAPIRDEHGSVVAAISVSGRISLLREQDVDRLIEEVVEVADRISVALGFVAAAH